MKYIIDRFEGDVAFCETADGKREEINKALLPESAKEGSAVEFDSNGKSRLDDSERVNSIASEMKKVFHACP